MNQDISNLIFKFANSFDAKAWQSLEATLMDHVECDYQDLRGNSGSYTKAEYVEKRKKALMDLKTQHIFSNLEIVNNEKQVICRLNAIIFRIAKDKRFFNTHALYTFGLIKLNNMDWKIKSIKQSILWNDGDPSIHKGITNE